MSGSRYATTSNSSGWTSYIHPGPIVTSRTVLGGSSAATAPATTYSSFIPSRPTCYPPFPSHSSATAIQSAGTSSTAVRSFPASAVQAPSSCPPPPASRTSATTPSQSYNSGTRSAKSSSTPSRSPLELLYSTSTWLAPSHMTFAANENTEGEKVGVTMDAPSFSPRYDALRDQLLDTMEPVFQLDAHQAPVKLRKVSWTVLPNVMRESFSALALSALTAGGGETSVGSCLGSKQGHLCRIASDQFPELPMTRFALVLWHHQYPERILCCPALDGPVPSELEPFLWLPVSVPTVHGMMVFHVAIDLLRTRHLRLVEGFSVLPVVGCATILGCLGALFREYRYFWMAETPVTYNSDQFSVRAGGACIAAARTPDLFAKLSDGSPSAVGPSTVLVFPVVHDEDEKSVDRGVSADPPVAVLPSVAFGTASVAAEELKMPMRILLGDGWAVNLLSIYSIQYPNPDMELSIRDLTAGMDEATKTDVVHTAVELLSPETGSIKILSATAGPSGVAIRLRPGGALWPAAGVALTDSQLSSILNTMLKAVHVNSILGVPSLSSSGVVAVAITSVVGSARASDNAFSFICTTDLHFLFGLASSQSASSAPAPPTVYEIGFNAGLFANVDRMAQCCSKELCALCATPAVRICLTCDCLFCVECFGAVHHTPIGRAHSSLELTQTELLSNLKKNISDFVQERPLIVDYVVGDSPMLSTQAPASASSSKASASSPLGLDHSPLVNHDARLTPNYSNDCRTLRPASAEELNELVVVERRPSPRPTSATPEQILRTVHDSLGVGGPVDMVRAARLLVSHCPMFSEEETALALDVLEAKCAHESIMKQWPIEAVRDLVKFVEFVGLWGPTGGASATGSSQWLAMSDGRVRGLFRKLCAALVRTVINKTPIVPAAFLRWRQPPTWRGCTRYLYGSCDIASAGGGGGGGVGWELTHVSFLLSLGQVAALFTHGAITLEPVEDEMYPGAPLVWFLAHPSTEMFGGNPPFPHMPVGVAVVVTLPLAALFSSGSFAAQPYFANMLGSVEFADVRAHTVVVSLSNPPCSNFLTPIYPPPSPSVLAALPKPPVRIRHPTEWVSFLPPHGDSDLLYIAVAGSVTISHAQPLKFILSPDSEVAVQFIDRIVSLPPHHRRQFAFSERFFPSATTFSSAAREWIREQRDGDLRLPDCLKALRGTFVVPDEWVEDAVM